MTGLRIAECGVWILVAMIACSGCGGKFTVQQMEKMPLARNIEPVAVAQTEKFTRLTDTGRHLDAKWIVPTGEYAGTLFTGGEGCPWQMDVVSSQLQLTWDFNWLESNIPKKVDYRISCVLSRGTRQWPMSASGSGYSSGLFDKAIMQAVCEAIIELRDRTATIMATEIQESKIENQK